MTDKRHPVWETIRRALADDLAEGRYRPGDKLPTEAALSRRFGVNRHTVRRALAALADAGMIYARRGSGVFVSQTRTDYPLGRRVSFTRNLRAAGRLPSRKVLLIETRAADRQEARTLRLPPGASVHSYDGLSLADREVIAVFRSVFPADHLPDLAAALNRLCSTTESLAAVGVTDYVREWTRVSALAATPTQALHLRLRTGAALLRTQALNVDSAGRPVEFGCTWFAGDRVTLTFDDHAAPTGG
ncbi:MAG: phosphonate metabolism transcriptional regulator PhnF [Pseudomonadota bacterium]